MSLVNDNNKWVADMFDLKRTLALIQGAIFDSETTWQSYLPEAGDWKRTAVLLTGPLIVGAAVLAYILSLIFPSRMPLAPSPSFGGMLLGIVLGAIAAATVAFLVSFLAGQFKGQHNFAKGLAATSLAFVPGYLGQVLATLPWIGWLLGFASFIYALVLLWKIIPVYLEVPGASRVGHYIASIITIVIALFILGWLIGAGSPGAMQSRVGSVQEPAAGAPSGMFGAMERQASIMDAAAQDRYDPPANGKLSHDQVRQYIDVMSKTQVLVQAQSEDLQALAEKAEEDKIGSVGDVFSGMGGIMQLQTAEMEVVKTGGSNWAEHLWVKEQLRVARVQQDINDTVKHNYELYKDYEERLRELEAL
jgi:hypothetical protein